LVKNTYLNKALCAIVVKMGKMLSNMTSIFNGNMG
jgi:hypothetical protein